MLPPLLPVPMPSRLSFNPVLPNVTWSTAVGVRLANGPVLHDDNKTVPARAAVPLKNWRRVILSLFIFILLHITSCHSRFTTNRHVTNSILVNRVPKGYLPGKPLFYAAFIMSNRVRVGTFWAGFSTKSDGSWKQKSKIRIFFISCWKSTYSKNTTYNFVDFRIKRAGSFNSRGAAF